MQTPLPTSQGAVDHYPLGLPCFIVRMGPLIESAADCRALLPSGRVPPPRAVVGRESWAGASPGRLHGAQACLGPDLTRRIWDLLWGGDADEPTWRGSVAVPAANWLEEARKGLPESPPRSAVLRTPRLAQGGPFWIADLQNREMITKWALL